MRDRAKWDAWKAVEGIGFEIHGCRKLVYFLAQVVFANGDAIARYLFKLLDTTDSFLLFFQGNPRRKQ